MHLAHKIEVTTDAAILLAAGTPEGWGLALVAGTGSIAYGRMADGRRARAGGWGHLLGDEGSAYALVLAGLRAVARAADGRGPATVLTERFLAEMSLSRPQELVPAIYRGGADRAALASGHRSFGRLPMAAMRLLSRLLKTQRVSCAHDCGSGTHA